MTGFLTLSIDVASASPNALGELLRDTLFDQKNGTEVGCYSTFDVRGGWVAWPGGSLMSIAYGDIGADHGWDTEEREFRQKEWDESATGYWKLFGTTPVHAAWFWDGDGTLAFGIGDPYDRVIINTDCKKDYEWEDAPCG